LQKDYKLIAGVLIWQQSLLVYALMGSSRVAFVYKVIPIFFSFFSRKIGWIKKYPAGFVRTPA
jgi:hypothetical protein